ncbi:hypothetical protein, partial [Klebsiella pneumoniae]|uniref:hypothetical protein n=1 Tax=Klebsiella pneumoniae TaxID=573 RepID=UPI0025A26E1E
QARTWGVILSCWAACSRSSGAQWLGDGDWAQWPGAAPQWPQETLSGRCSGICAWTVVVLSALPVATAVPTSRRPPPPLTSHLTLV